METGEVRRAYKETQFGTWEEGDPTLFWVRGAEYLDDREKIQATGGPVLRLIHMDLFQGPFVELNIFPRLRDRLPDDVGVLSKDRAFYVIFNFLIRGNDRTLDKKKKTKSESWINWVSYFALPKNARKDPANEQFFKCWDALLKGDEKARNHRIKVIPCVADGPWIVRAAIGGGKDSHKGATPTLVGEKVTTNYFEGDDYLEIDYNTAIDNVAVTSAKLAFDHSKKIVVDTAIILQAESTDELPERVAGCSRCSWFVINAAELFPGTKPENYRMKKSKEEKEKKDKKEKDDD